MPSLMPERKPAPSIDSLRIPPHSIEAEQAVLGGIMLQPEAWDRIADLVTAEDFYRRDHRLIFAAIGQLIERNQPCDAITLGEWFESQQQAGDVGGMGYLAELVNNTPSAANVRAYAEIVREKSLLRRLIDAGVSIAEDGYRPEGRATRELVDLAEQRVFAIAEGGKRAG
ncbi:replicative DNA helicase, partial [mine drainage metagenome]